MYDDNSKKKMLIPMFYDELQCTYVGILPRTFQTKQKFNFRPKRFAAMWYNIFFRSDRSCIYAEPQHELLFRVLLVVR